MRPFYTCGLGLLCALLLAACETVPRLDGTPPVGRVVVASGEVQVLRGDRAIAIGHRSWIFAGDSIVSELDAAVTVDFSDNTTIALKAGGVLDIASVDPTEKQMRFVLTRGALRLDAGRFARHGGYQIATRYAGIYIARSQVLVAYGDGEGSVAIVHQQGDPVRVTNKLGERSTGDESAGVLVELGRAPAMLEPESLTALMDSMLFHE